jgi:hypothetical protein
MRILNAPEVADWVRNELLSPARERPTVAVTTRPHDGGAWVDPRALDEAIGALADIVFLETGDPTWELAEALPPRLDAYGGAVRIWWPGLTESSNPYDHRLHFVRSAVEAKLESTRSSRPCASAAAEGKETHRSSKRSLRPFAEPRSSSSSVTVADLCALPTCRSPI